MRLPLVVKPRFGSWGQDVALCTSRRALEEQLCALAFRPWFLTRGALAQELVPPQGYDLRLVVAGGRVVGAVRRIAKEGEWRTNVSLGAHREPAEPPADAVELAIAAAAAVEGALVGVDLLPLPKGGWTVVELNGAVDFTEAYAPGRDLFADAARERGRGGRRTSGGRGPLTVPGTVKLTGPGTVKNVFQKEVTLLASANRPLSAWFEGMDAMALWWVSDELWELVGLLIPPVERRFRYPGRRRIDDRAVLSGIIYVLRTGIAWEHLPREFGCSGATCWRRLREWQEQGAWSSCTSCCSPSWSRRSGSTGRGWSPTPRSCRR